MKDTLISILLITLIYFTFIGMKRYYICVDKETPDWTGTTQGEYVLDTIKDQREQDSINDYMRHWYEVCDTNSDGDIDGTE